MEQRKNSWLLQLPIIAGYGSASHVWPQTLQAMRGSNKWALPRSPCGSVWAGTPAVRFFRVGLSSRDHLRMPCLSRRSAHPASEWDGVQRLRHFRLLGTSSRTFPLLHLPSSLSSQCQSLMNMSHSTFIRICLQRTQTMTPWKVNPLKAVLLFEGNHL